MTAADFAHAENRLLDAAFRPPVASLLCDIKEIRAFNQADRALLDEALVLPPDYACFHGWFVVAVYLLLPLGFGYFQFMKPSASQATPLTPPYRQSLLGRQIKGLRG